MLAGKKILVAICGSIAAYKIAFFVRLLKKEGAIVQVLMTESAKDFISPLTLATLSKNPIKSRYFDPEDGSWNNHVELGLWADLMVIAPLSANTLSKMASGQCDNLILATYLSARCKVLVAPAMDLDMYQHPATQQNLSLLRSFGHEVLDARNGELASGLSGQGRMAEPEELLDAVKQNLTNAGKLQGKRVMITSGPTHEAIDPVRFIGNHSSGKMGLALANAFRDAGAEVTFITGPVNDVPSRVEVIEITTAKEMVEVAKHHHSGTDIAIFAAAVADYRPAHTADQKIKKTENSYVLEMVKNPDIAAILGASKTNQIHIGFALETENELTNAKEKLSRKNFDLIVLNSLNDKGAGFQQDTNRVTFHDRDNNQVEFELKNKRAVAEDILAYVHQNFL
ncbi:MAG: bifunctional phosphopantothenoylcysteine decarboxylase/phosphopantothenate--cysteine ligase CoaBC [Bacteroidota bacterium]